MARGLDGLHGRPVRAIDGRCSCARVLFDSRNVTVVIKKRQSKVGQEADQIRSGAHSSKRTLFGHCGGAKTELKQLQAV